MPPRAVDNCEGVDSADLPVVTNAPAPLDAGVANEGGNVAPATDGEKFFAATITGESAEVPVEKSGTKKCNSGFSFSFSSLEKSICKFGRQLEDEFVAAIDKTPLGVNVGPQPASRTAKDSSEESAPSDRALHAPTLERKHSSFAKAAKAAKKTGVAVGGGALIGVGVVMIPTLPPPFASLTMLGGYALLGTEFEGPRKVVNNARDKMRNIEDDEDEAGEDDTTTEIEEEFTEGEPEDLLKHSASVTDAEYWGFGKDADDETKKSSKKKIEVKKTAKKLSKKYVLPALEKVCSAYEVFDEEGNKDSPSDAGKTYEEINADELADIAEKEVERIAMDTETTTGEVSARSSISDDDVASEKFVDAKEEWVDVNEVNQVEGKNETLAEDSMDCDEDAVLV